MTHAQVIRWWEFRRLIYNAVLLVVGVASIAGMEWLMDGVLPFGEDAVEPAALILGIAVYAVLANIFYTLGWVVELWARRFGPELARKRGQQLFRIGLAFSCLITTAPFWFGCLYRISHERHGM